MFNISQKNIAVVGPPLGSLVGGLLHCVQLCGERKCCEVFTYNLSNHTCVVYSQYELLPDVRHHSDVVHSLISDWLNTLRKVRTDFDILLRGRGDLTQICCVSALLTRSPELIILKVLVRTDFDF